MGSTEEDEISVRKQSAVRKKGNDTPNTQKATRVIRARDDTSDIEKGGDVSENLDSGGSNPDTDGNSHNESSSSVDDLEPQLGSEVASVSEKKNPSVHKPSKRVIETALNEVSLVTMYQQSRSITHQRKQAIFIEKPEVVAKVPTSLFTTIRVKAEDTNANNNGGSDKDDGGKANDTDNMGSKNGDCSHNSEKRQAERIYNRSLKILKFKLYF